ncbi:hypothetical protein [Methanobrevibacter sp.]|uniref:hypothetical protein n=1 Tax=Methanobrevibacter sp. TaxID=66852 RepID=UPI00388F679E
MKTQTILDKFEAVSTTINVLEKGNGEYLTFNEFGVVPVKCDIRFILQGDDYAVEDEFYVDTIILDTSDDCITFELANNTKQMLYPEDILELDVTKISQSRYLEAIIEDKCSLEGLF